jgi:hypothetical protein
MGPTQTETTVDQTQTVTEAVRAEVAPMFDTLRAFVDRRIA